MGDVVWWNPAILAVPGSMDGTRGELSNRPECETPLTLELVVLLWHHRILEDCADYRGVVHRCPFRRHWYILYRTIVFHAILSVTSHREIGGIVGVSGSCPVCLTCAAR